jgi:hypothetical protein
MAKDLDKNRQSGRNAEVDAFLMKVAATPTVKPAGAKGRLIFALDATASREPTWDHACHIQAEMFSEAASLGGLEIQMVYFRGFGEFKAAPWLSKSGDLIRHMTAVSCLGGHTQITKVLRHAIAEKRKGEVNALVYVGDCMEEDVDDLCQLAGELGLLGVPAFVFQEGREPVAMAAFKQIAKLTNGAYCSFDTASAQTLRDLLRAVAAYAAGGRKALENFSRSSGREVRLIASQMKS